MVKTYAKKHRPNLHLNIHKDRTIALTCSLLSRTCIPQKPWVSCLSIAFRRSSSGLVPWPCSHACPLSPQTVETTCAQICLSVYLSIYLSIYRLSIYPSSICLSTCLSIVYLSICLSSIYLYIVCRQDRLK